MRSKVTVVGVGNVGGTVAQRIAEKELADVVLVDILEGIAMGKALDLAEAAPIEKHDARLMGATDYSLVENSDIVVVTAGVPRKPGMSRDDLCRTNASIVQNIVEQVARLAPHSILIIVSNPLDAMCHVAYKTSGFPRQRVLGMGGVLDSARLRTFIAMELNVSVENVDALVLGCHSDAMVPLPRYSTVAGIPITELMTKDQIDRIVERTRFGGGEVVQYLKNGSAFYAPASAVFEMVEAIIKDKNKILPCAVWLTGEYDINGLFFGVPVKIGKDGLEEIIQIPLREEEKAALAQSASAVQGLLDTLKKLGF